MSPDQIQEFLKLVFVFFYAVILHECAHGWVANKLGDPTAKMLGRLTLNPLKHVDLIGTILLPVTLLLVHSSVVFGWAKPVPVNYLNLRHPRRDMMWVGIAGPIVNIALAFIFSWLLALPLSQADHRVVEMAIIINLVLAVFNMMPIPPLDGSRLVMAFLPKELALPYARLENYGIAIVFLLLYMGIFDKLVWPIVKFLAQSLGVT